MMVMIEKLKAVLLHFFRRALERTDRFLARILVRQYLERHHSQPDVFTAEKRVLLHQLFRIGKYPLHGHVGEKDGQAAALADPLNAFRIERRARILEIGIPRFPQLYRGGKKILLRPYHSSYRKQIEPRFHFTYSPFSSR